MLDGRYEEMRLRYWENRAAAEKLIHDVERYTPLVPACFAAARAALQWALEDGVITNPLFTLSLPNVSDVRPAGHVDCGVVPMDAKGL